MGNKASRKLNKKGRRKLEEGHLVSLGTGRGCNDFSKHLSVTIREQNEQPRTALSFTL